MSLLGEYYRANASDIEFQANHAAIVKLCHAKQRRFVEDAARRVSACCSRRAGKSVGILARHLLDGLAHPGEMSVYVNRSVAAGRDVLEPALRALQRQGLSMKVKPWKPDRLYWVLPNGHKIWIAGCADRPSIEDFRGQPFTSATVDEAQQFSFLGELLDEAIEPALLDFNGALTLIGTPGLFPTGRFFESSNSQAGYSAHHWTVLDNSFMRTDPAAFLEQTLKNHNWTEQTPKFVREYKGQWVADLDSAVYPYSKTKNAWVEMPGGNRRRVLAVDLGSTGTSAFVIIATVENQPGFWIEHIETAKGLGVSDVCSKVRDLRARFSATQIVMDAGGLGGAYISELGSRWSLHAEAAVKTNKRAYIEEIRDDILAGRIYLPETGAPKEFWDEVSVLSWNDAHTKYEDDLPDHICDAILYGWRALVPQKRVAEAPVQGSPEWYRAEEARMLKEAQARLAKQRKLRL